MVDCTANLATNCNSFQRPSTSNRNRQRKEKKYCLRMLKENCRTTSSSGTKVILIALITKELDFLQRHGLQRKAKRLVQFCLSRKKQQSEKYFSLPRVVWVSKSPKYCFQPTFWNADGWYMQSKAKSLGKEWRILNTTISAHQKTTQSNPKRDSQEARGEESHSEQHE